MNPAVATVEISGIPLLMRQESRWGLWRYETRDGKPTKVPYRLDGTRARSTEAKDWVGFPEAAAWFIRSGPADGLGFRLGGGWAGVDLDHCVEDDGTTLAWATSILELLDSYSEYSPSGMGIKIFILGALPQAQRRRAGHVEMYDSGRYFTVTGKHVEGTPQEVQERTNELNTLHRRVFEQDRPPSHPPLPSLQPDEWALLAKARNAKNGGAFSLLYDGDTSGYASYSEADLALVSHLSYWAKGDAATVDRLFRASGLYRSKWDERHGAGTYGQLTIDKVTTSAKPPPMRFSGPIGL